MSAPTATGSGTFHTESLTTLHWVGILLALVSGVVHLALGVMFFPGVQPVAFLLAGLGFFGAVVLLLLDYRRRLLYALGVPFVTLQIILYLWLNQRVQPAVSPIEAVDKVAQVLLILVLLVLYRRES